MTVIDGLYWTDFKAIPNDVTDFQGQSRYSAGNEKLNLVGAKTFAAIFG